MTGNSIRQGLKTRAVGRRIVCVDKCTSTNDLAWKGGVEGAAHGTAYFAEEQEKGRGRWGRKWTAPRGTAVLCSILLRPEIDADRAPLMTALGALAVTDMASGFGIDAQVRFPNDVMIADKKLAGILVESRFISSRPDLFVLGIGVNVNGRPTGIPATSMAKEAGSRISRPRVARAILEAVDEWVARLDGPVAPFQKEWRKRSDMLNRKIRIHQEGRTYIGTVSEVDCMAGVEVRLSNGHVRFFRGEYIERIEMVEGGAQRRS